ncbi:MAG: hypothetical protein Q4B81_00135 [Moraxella sp.]|nr:hypothetical protein [Moraxella sp.]
MYVDGLLSSILVLWIVWLAVMTPYVVRRASLSMQKVEFEMLFTNIWRLAVCLLMPCLLIVGLLLWRFFVLLSHDMTAGNGVLWFIVALIGLMLLVLHSFVNAVYYVAVLHLGVGRD